MHVHASTTRRQRHVIGQVRRGPHEGLADFSNVTSDHARLLQSELEPDSPSKVHYLRTFARFTVSGLCEKEGRKIAFGQ